MLKKPERNISGSGTGRANTMIWDREAVRPRIREVWDTLRRMPAPNRLGCISSWPTCLRDMSEALGQAEGRVRLSPASPQAIDRMYEAIGWFTWLEGQPHLTRAMWLTCGMGMGPKRAGLFIGAHRDTIRNRRDMALDLIAQGLNQRLASAA
jgi:hypothetical protein